jgi:hypothetical protein
MDSDGDLCAKNACCDDYCTGDDCITCENTPGVFSGQYWMTSCCKFDSKTGNPHKD